MNDNTMELLEILKKVDKTTYKVLKKYENATSFGLEEMHQLDVIESRLYKLFKKIVDKNTRTELKIIDETIKEYENIIRKNTGFSISSLGAIKTDNYQNQEDHEFATHDTYRIPRNEFGFYVPKDGEDSNGYFQSIYDTCMHILKQHEYDFYILHKYYTKKENILSGQYKLRNNIDENLPILISKKLGYIKEDLPKTRKRS